jgi:hypothetical protein
MNKTTVVYYRPGCPFGIRLRIALTLHRVPFTAVRFRADVATLQRLVRPQEGTRYRPPSTSRNGGSPTQPGVKSPPSAEADAVVAGTRSDRATSGGRLSERRRTAPAPGEHCRPKPQQATPRKPNVDRERRITGAGSERTCPAKPVRRHSRSWSECQESTDVPVNHQPEHRHASTEHQMSSINRSRTAVLWAPWCLVSRHS